MALSRRLKTIADMVPRCELAADIGCDHGQLARYLLEVGKADSVIASDISAPSLQKAAQLLAPYQNAANIRLGDGLAVLEPGEADVIVIAGMGGFQMVRVLKNDLSIIKNALLVLGPHRDARLVREFLLKSGFVIEEERVAVDGGFCYNLIAAKVETHSDPYTKWELELGRFKDYADLDVRKYLQVQQAKTLDVAAKLAAAGKEPSRVKFLEDLAQYIQRLLNA